jgi:hypothetical protein
MSESQETQASPPRRRSRKLAAVVAGIFGAGLIAGVTIAGLNLAGAQTPDPSPSASPNGEEEKTERAPLGKLGGHHGGPGGLGGRGVLHGEFVTRGPNEGSFQTLATQYGDVTEVSASSISVKSEDGFTRTYAVNDDTLVNAGNDGIGDVKSGDEVRIVAVVENNKARAVQIYDGTNVRELRGKWQPRRPAPEERQPEEPAQTGSNA